MPPTGGNDWPEQGICSSAYVEGDRLHYVSNRRELVRADVEGFDDENDGPYRDENTRAARTATRGPDMIDELTSFRTTSRRLPGCTMRIHLLTGQRRTMRAISTCLRLMHLPHRRRQETGKVVWQKDDSYVLYGQWGLWPY